MLNSRIIKYSIIALLVISSFITFTTCNSVSDQSSTEPAQAPLFVDYSDEIHGFSIQYPNGWIEISQESLESAIIGFSPTVENFTNHASIIISRTNLGSKMTVSAFYENLINDIFEQTGYNLNSKEEQFINNKPTIKLLYSVDKQDFSFKGARLLLVQNGYGWIITCISSKESFDALEPTFNEVFDSFTINETTASTAKPSIHYFRTDKDTIISGESIILSWNVSDATYITLLPMVSGVDITGNKQLSPTQSTSYTLTAYNDFGSSSNTIDITVRPDDRVVVGYDPVTGRNASIGFTWEQLCLASEYQVQIAKDPGFTLLVFDSGVFSPDSSTSPALLYGAGGVLEAGHTYYWRARVRGTVTGEDIYGPWSLPQSIVVSSGNPVTATSYSGVQLLSPSSNCIGNPVESVAFSWTPFESTNKYRFTLAKKADMTDIIVTAEVPNTSYLYSGKLEYNTAYYWQVMALEPAPSDPSAVFSFVTRTQQVQEPVITEAIPEKSAEVPVWVWVLISIGTILIIVIIVFIFKARR